MIMYFYRNCICLFTIILLITSCSGGKAPVVERNSIGKKPSIPESNNLSQPSFERSYYDNLISSNRDSLLPRNIGIILPFDEAYMNISKSIINGIVQAYYSSSRLMRDTKLFFYPSDSASLDQNLRQIKKDQIEFLIGPLRKDKLAKIMERISGKVNVLALNVDNSIKNKQPGIFQFPLNPEEEARQVANYARTKGTRAIIITQNTNWGQRISRAYQEEWSNSEGKVLANIVFDPSQKNFSEIIIRALHIDESYKRRKNLAKLIQSKLKFEARRRRGIQ